MNSLFSDGSDVSFAPKKSSDWFNEPTGTISDVIVQYGSQQSPSRVLWTAAISARKPYSCEQV